MTPLLFATALTLLGPSPVQNPLDHPAPAPLQKDLKAPTFSAIVVAGNPNLQKDLKGNLTLCNRPVTKAVGPAGAPVRKLGDLPPGLEEHAVVRLVNGCPVREIVSGGRTYYLDMPVATLDRIDPAKVAIDRR